MKSIRPVVFLFIIVTAFFSLHALYADTAEDSVGTVSRVDSAKKEVLVKKDNVQHEFRQGEKFSVRTDGKPIVLEIINSMYTQVRCRVVNDADVPRIKENMKVYVYSGDAAVTLSGLSDADLADREKALLYAVYAGQAEKVKSLIEAGADVNTTTGDSAPEIFTGYSAQESYYFTPLHLAAVWNRVAIVEILLQSGADFTTGTYTPYSYALSCNNLECARVFIRFNADKGAGGITPLVKAVILGDTVEVKRLIAAGADVNERSYVERTAIMFASTAEIVSMLLDAGADPNLRDMFNSSALWNMANSGYIEPARVLVQRSGKAGLEIDNHGSYGDTPFMRAAMMGHLEMAKFLNENGADVNSVNNYGTTALILAAAEGHTEMVRFLLEKGAGINARNHGGDTALIQAAYNGYRDTVGLLLEAGADASIAAEDGKTALDLARERGFKDIADMISASFKKGK